MSLAVKVTKTQPPASAQPAFQSRRSFVQRLIEITIKLASDTQSGQPNTFADTGGSDTITLSGIRTSVRIENNGAPAGSSAHVTMHGLTQSLMNQLTTLGIVYDQIQRNTITVKAGDSETGLTPVFTGTIVQAYGDYNSAPDVSMRLECQSGTIDAVAPVAASSFTGPTDVATIMAGFARQMNVGFENSGVTVQLSNPYFAGNIETQMRKAAAHANIYAEVIEGKLCIWPKGGSRTTPGAIPLLDKDSGLVGYPIYTPQGIVIKSLFIPQISFGTTIQVKSSVKIGATNASSSAPKATQSVADVGTWVVWKLDLDLDSMVPKGNWLATMYCYAKGFPAPIPPSSGG